jgi:hypothetical protein
MELFFINTKMLLVCKSASKFDLKTDEKIINTMVEMFDSLATSNQTNFRQFIIRSVPSRLASIVAGSLKNCGILAGINGEEAIVPKVRSRIRKAAKQLVKASVEALEAQTTQGSNGEETSVPDDLELGETLLEVEQDPIDVNTLLDHAEDVALEETEGNVRIGKVTEINKIIDKLFQYPMTWSVPKKIVGDTVIPLKRYSYSPSPELKEWIKQLLNAKFHPKLTLLDEEYFSREWKGLLDFYKKWSPIAVPCYRISPRCHYTARSFYFTHASITAFPDDVTEKTEYQQTFDKVTPNLAPSTSQYVSNEVKTKKFLNVIDFIISDIKTHLGVMQHLNFTFKKPSSVPSFQVALDWYNKLRAAHLYAKKLEGDFKRKQDEERNKSSNTSSNPAPPNTPVPNTPLPLNPMKIPVFIIKLVESFLFKKYRLVFGLDSDSVAVSIRTSRWCPRRTSSPVKSTKPTIPFFIGENCVQNDERNAELFRLINEKDGYDKIMGLDPGGTVVADLSTVIRDGWVDGKVIYKLEPSDQNNPHKRFTSGMLRNYTGKTRHSNEMERLKGIKGEDNLTMYELEQRIISPCDPNNYLDHLVQYFTFYDRLHDFYSKKKFTKQKLARFIRKSACVDNWILQNIFGLKEGEKLKDFMKLGIKILVVFGNANWKYDCGLRFCSSISSSRQLCVKIQFLIRTYNKLAASTISTSIQTFSRIDFIKASEMFTSQICHKCKTKTLKKKMTEYQYTGHDGVEYIGWKQSRTFGCTSELHAHDKKFVNRDRNASANIVWNVIYAAMGLLDSTTWIIGKN